MTGKPQMWFYAGAPLRTPKGLTLGTRCVLDTAPRLHGLTQEQAEGLHVRAARVMAQLELCREPATGKAEIARLVAA